MENGIDTGVRRMNDERAEKIMEDVASKLADMGFDAVVVTGCYMNDDGHTASATSGRGNWYARVGMLQELVVVENARLVGHAMRHGG